MPAKRAAAPRKPRQSAKPRYDPATLRLLLETALAQGGHPATQELRFHKTRKWRIDYAFPDAQPPLAVELEGGVWGGRHVTGKGFLADIEKYNALTIAGWRLLRITYDMISSGDALTLIEAALGSPHTEIEAPHGATTIPKARRARKRPSAAAPA